MRFWNAPSEPHNVGVSHMQVILKRGSSTLRYHTHPPCNIIIRVNSLNATRRGCNINYVIFKHIFIIEILVISDENSLRRMPWADYVDDKLTLVHMLAGCR